MNFLQAGISGSLVDVGKRTFKRNSRNICKGRVNEVMNWHYVSDVHLVQNEFLVLWVFADQPLIGLIKALKAARREALPERKIRDHHCKSNYHIYLMAESSCFCASENFTTFFSVIFCWQEVFSQSLFKYFCHFFCPVNISLLLERLHVKYLSKPCAIFEQFYLLAPALVFVVFV